MTQERQVRLPEYLDHILKAIARIGRFVRGRSAADFIGDEMLQDAVIRNIEIIGEAARNIELSAPEFCAEHPEVPWATIYAMRNRVAHGYFEVDLDLVWRTVTDDLPGLRSQIASLLAELAGDQSH